MSDFYVNWNGDIAFGDSGDLRTATDDDLARQRIVRRLLTNPVLKTVDGTILQPAGDLFNPDYGAGLTRDIDSTNDANSRADRNSRIRTSLAAEPVIDQSKPIDVQFISDRIRSIEYVSITCTTLSGSELQIALQL